jgi:hypothetical protein
VTARQTRARRQKFLALYPWCCFCGGAALATTEDHVPNRALFDNRHWPEGYNFPACKPCNDATRPDEKIMAFLSRINHGPRPLTAVEETEARKSLRGMLAEFPTELSSMRLSSNEIRDWLRGRRETRPPGVLLSDIPLVSIGTPRFRNAIKRFCIKLLCALHYKHAGEIVPVNAAVCGRWMSNVQVSDGLIPPEVLRLCGSTAKLTRAKNDLSEQFEYSFIVAREKTTSVFLCSFRQSFVVIGTVSYDWNLPDQFDEDLECGVFKDHPFPTSAKA